MNKSYKVKCKLCGDILEEQLPVKKEVKCTCGNIALYSDYIAYNCLPDNHLSREECYEDLKKEKLVKEQLEKHYQELEHNSERQKS